MIITEHAEIQVSVFFLVAAVLFIAAVLFVPVFVKNQKKAQLTLRKGYALLLMFVVIQIVHTIYVFT